MLQSRVLKLINILSSLLLIWVFLGKSNAQTTLLPGDIVVVTANISANEIELIPLINIDAGTVIELKGTSEENTFDPVIITFEKSVMRGQRLNISNKENDVIIKSGELDISNIKGVITLSQPDEGINRLLFGFSWGNYNTSSPFPLEMDNSLPFLRFGEGSNFQYHLKNGASGTTGMLVNMISNPANWKSSEKAFGSFQTSLRILAGPVIVFDQNVSTVAENDSIRLNVAIYEHDGSKLTVDAKLHQEYSTADTNDVNLFKSYTFNFTGLIGDAVYEIVIPLYDDEIFEDRETAFFELENLSAGQFGDFISHASFILDNEIPNVDVNVTIDPEYTLPVLSITNNERVYLDVNGWIVQVGEFGIELSDLLEIAPFEGQNITLDGFVNSNELAKLNNISIKNVRILDRNNKLIEEAKPNKKENLVKVDRKENAKNKIEIEISDIENDPIAASESLSSANAIINTSNDSSKIAEKGWRPFQQEMEFNEEQEIMFWDEKKQTFREVNSSNQDSASGYGMIFFYDPENKTEDQFEQFEDSTIQTATQFTSKDWIVSLSATDIDEDGIISGSEGLNLIQNRSGSPVSVSVLMKIFSENFGEGTLSPYVFGWNFDPQNIKTEEDIIQPEELFWVKADSLIDLTQIVISQEQLTLISPEVALLTEPVSTLTIQLSSENSTQSTHIHLFDGEVAYQKSIQNPVLEMGRNEVISQGLTFGLKDQNLWFSKLHLQYTSDALYAIPIGFSDTISTKMTLEISDWNLEGGWQLFIEDTETEEQIELLPGISFSFEYVAQNDVSESETESNSEQINQRYKLLMVPPGVEVKDESIPEQIELFQNYPNPFNPATTISFYLPEPEEVSLSVFNVVGQPVATLTKGVLNVGEHHFEWNATGYPSGMYIYQLEVGTKVLTRKMTLVK